MEKTQAISMRVGFRERLPLQVSGSKKINIRRYFQIFLPERRKARPMLQDNRPELTYRD